MSAWISCTDRLPEINPNEESDWVLVRLATGAVYVAQLCESVWSGGEVRVQWVARGQDAYDLENVVAWAEIPA